MTTPLGRAAMIGIATLALCGCRTSRSDRETGPFDPPSRTASATTADLDRLKTLAGDWDADFDGDGEGDARVSFQVTANGSALVERQFEGEPYEMVTVYHLDGDRLMLTHYCAATNQPRMVATRIGEDAIEFDLLDITNLATRESMHIHAARIEFIDDDHARSTWTHWEDGRPGEAAVFNLSRRR